MKAGLCALILALVAATVCRAAEAVIDCCAAVEVVAGNSEQDKAARGFCTLACRKIKIFESMFATRHGRKLTIRVCRDMQDFMRRSGKPWFVGAALVDDQIMTQPARSLNKIDDPQALVTHELVHWFIRRIAGRNCPHWLDEGLAQWLAGQKSGLIAGSPADLPSNTVAIGKLNTRLESRPSGKRDLARAYRTSLLLVEKLIAKVGLEKLLAALPGFVKVSDPLKLIIAGKPLAKLIFEGT